MSRKKLDIGTITNELEGASLFFAARPEPATSLPSLEPKEPAKETLLPATEPVIEKPMSTTPTLIEKSSHTQLPMLKKSVSTPKPPNERANERTSESSSDQPVGANHIRTIERTIEASFERTKGREKIRHSFDIFADQLISLKEIAIAQEKLFGERVLMGELVQQAIDMLIAKETNK